MLFTESKGTDTVDSADGIEIEHDGIMTLDMLGTGTLDGPFGPYGANDGPEGTGGTVWCIAIRGSVIEPFDVNVGVIVQGFWSKNLHRNQRYKMGIKHRGKSEGKPIMNQNRL